MAMCMANTVIIINEQAQPAHRLCNSAVTAMRAPFAQAALNIFMVCLVA
jgi:hypothetical protein